MAFKLAGYYTVLDLKVPLKNPIFNLHRAFPELLVKFFVIIMPPPQERFSPFAF